MTEARDIAYGTLVSKIEASGDLTVTPVSDHVAFFVGGVPCDREGRPLVGIINSSRDFALEQGLDASHRLSSKPADGSKYSDYYAKMTAYVTMIASHAASLDSSVTAQTYHVEPDAHVASPFAYPDTASSRAGIATLSDRLRLQRLAIVGVGGTGSYILDLVAKVPVEEIHLFDGDTFRSHNAFRAPGAVSLDDLNAQPSKAEHFAGVYAAMRRGVIAHPYALNSANVDELRAMDFVFIAMEGGDAKRAIIQALTAFGTSFIDVGIGVTKRDDGLGGIVRITASTTAQRGHVGVGGRIDFTDPGPEDLYDENIQVGDLNALNAALAVIKWKKMYRFYADLEREHHSTYTIDGNHLVNEDLA